MCAPSAGSLAIHLETTPQRQNPPPMARDFCVSEGGLEPPRPFGHWHLKPARLPIPPLRRDFAISIQVSPNRGHIVAAPVGSSTNALSVFHFVGSAFSRCRRTSSNSNRAIEMATTPASQPTSADNPAPPITIAMTSSAPQITATAAAAALRAVMRRSPVGTGRRSCSRSARLVRGMRSFGRARLCSVEALRVVLSEVLSTPLPRRRGAL